MAFDGSWLGRDERDMRHTDGLARLRTKVNSLSKHVTGDGGLGRRDPQPLAQDPTPVGKTRPVPQQLAVAHSLVEAACLAFTLNLERLSQLETVGGVGGGVCVLQVLVKKVMHRIGRVNRAKLGVELGILGVDRMHIEGWVFRVDDARCNLNLAKGLDHLDLCLELGWRVNQLEPHIASGDLRQHTRLSGWAVDLLGGRDLWRSVGLNTVRISADTADTVHGHGADNAHSTYWVTAHVR
jgi:hypothetical protein